MIRDRLIRWLGGIVPDPMATPECQHVWTNWSAPQEIELRATYFRGWMGSTGGPLAEERLGWSQDRYCTKCNEYERRLA